MEKIDDIGILSNSLNRDSDDAEQVNILNKFPKFLEKVLEFWNIRLKNCVNVNCDNHQFNHFDNFMKLSEISILLGGKRIPVLFAVNSKEVMKEIENLKEDEIILECNEEIKKMSSEENAIMTRVTITLAGLCDFIKRVRDTLEKLKNISEKEEQVLFDFVKIEIIDKMLFSLVNQDTMGKHLKELIQMIKENLDLIHKKVGARYENNPDYKRTTLQFDLLETEYNFYFSNSDKINSLEIKNSMTNFLKEILINKENLEEELWFTKHAIQIFLSEEYREGVNFNITEGEEYDYEAMIGDKSTKDEDEEVSVEIEISGDGKKLTMGDDGITKKSCIIFKRK